METINFSILIDAPKQKVWDTMLEDNTYRQWTSEFAKGSCYEGNWEKGSEIRFIAPGEGGKSEGMYSRIKENIPNEFISIEHLGIIVGGVVDTTSDQVRKWAPSLENYTFISLGNQTELRIEMEVEPEYKKMFEDMWPRALQALKKLSEKIMG